MIPYRPRLRLPLRLVIIALLCLQMGRASAQNEHHYGDQYTSSLAVEVNTSLSSAGWVVTPAVSVFRNSHKVAVGVMVPLYDVWEHGQGYGGLQLGYKYFSARRRKTTNLYFCYHMMLFIRDRSTVMPEIEREAASPLLTDLNYRYEHLLGIGLDTHIGKRVYMFFEWNAGISINWLTLKNGEPITEVQSSGMGRIGMGINLLRHRPR